MANVVRCTVCGWFFRAETLKDGVCPPCRARTVELADSKTWTFDQLDELDRIIAEGEGRDEGAV